MESIGTEGDLTAGLEREEKGESSEGDLETPSEIAEADQPLSYITWFANAVKLYQRKTGIDLGVAVLTIWWRIVQRIL